MRINRQVRYICKCMFPKRLVKVCRDKSQDLMKVKGKKEWGVKGKGLGQDEMLEHK